jgi:2-polyprenyl-3-methyl-5-hydroxy-6-metoxy-1,4-benzoquinol methylase
MEYWSDGVMEYSTTATAVTYWDECWADEKGRERWLTPTPEVQDIVSVLKERGVKHVLDLGCGVGRHALFLASQGFQACALDGSAKGLNSLATKPNARD